MVVIRQGPMTVVHCMKKPYDVYIGRPSKWGNPFSDGDVDPKFRVPTREDAIEMYRKFLEWKIEQHGDAFLRELAELDGKTLGCWCSPKACHGDVLVKYAKQAKETLDDNDR